MTLRAWLVLALAAGHSISAQATPRQLTLVQDLRIGASTLGAQRDPLVAVGPDGRIAAVGRFGWGDILVFDSMGKPLPWKLPTGRRDEAEIMFPTQIGWIAGSDTMWVGDPGYKQVVLVDGKGKVVKSIEYPSWIHPHWADRHKYPLFASMEPVAVYRDQTMLIVPARERSLVETQGYDRSMVQVLRTAWSGAIQRGFAVSPVDHASIRLRTGACDHVIAIPYASRTYWAASSDGMRIVSVAPGVALADSGTIRVTVRNDQGDTVFSRSLPQPAVRVPQLTIDNFLAGIRACGPLSAEQLRDSVTKRTFAFRSFVTGVMPGRDHSTWVMMRPASDTSRERTATILDARGDLVGTVILPADRTPVAVDRDHLWALEVGKMRAVSGIVRYRVEATAAPPARSGPGATSSRPSRPPA